MFWKQKVTAKHRKGMTGVLIVQTSRGAITCWSSRARERSTYFLPTEKTQRHYFASELFRNQSRKMVLLS